MKHRWSAWGSAILCRRAGAETARLKASVAVAVAVAVAMARWLAADRTGAGLLLAVLTAAATALSTMFMAITGMMRERWGAEGTKLLPSTPPPPRWLACRPSTALRPLSRWDRTNQSRPPPLPTAAPTLVVQSGTHVRRVSDRRQPRGSTGPTGKPSDGPNGFERVVGSIFFFFC